MARPTPITSPQHFTTLLSSTRIAVVDFHADWCGPCAAIAPAYEALAAQLTRPGVLAFAKVNVDEQRQIAQTYNISAMPTFMVFKSGREAKRIKGADLKALDKAVRELAAEASSAGAEAEASASASAAQAGGAGWLGASLPRGYGDVTEAVDQLNLDFLNLDSEAGGARVVFENGKPSALGGAGGGKKDYIESDTDEQMMLFVPFQSTMKLHTLQVTSVPGEGGEEEVGRPKTLRLYTNRSHTLGFDEADGEPATQTIEIGEDSWDEKTGTAKVELRFVKFQNISSLVVFVVDNDKESEKTRIDRLRLVGDTGEKKAMGKLEKFGDEQGE